MLKPVISDRSLVVSGLTIAGGIFLAQCLAIDMQARLVNEVPIDRIGKFEPLAATTSFSEMSVDLPLEISFAALRSDKTKRNRIGFLESFQAKERIARKADLDELATLDKIDPTRRLLHPVVNDFVGWQLAIPDHV
ncbi:MAG TPA: hypothetical protein VFU31_29845 [Candidatus Binatia bacterium]|nr:hypothetical protein [Candidatus Binatia bacterium]